MKPLDATVAAVDRLAKKLRAPDADVRPTLIIQTPWETKIMDAVTRDPEEKDLLYRVAVPNFIAKTKARSVTLVTMMWFTSHALPEGGESALVRNEEGIVQPPDGIMPRDSPNREERLMVVEATATSTEMFWARVVRSPTDPPRFDPLEPLEARYEAYILRHAQRALRAVAGPG